MAADGWVVCVDGLIVCFDSLERAGGVVTGVVWFVCCVCGVVCLACGVSVCWAVCVVVLAFLSECWAVCVVVLGVERGRSISSRKRAVAERRFAGGVGKVLLVVAGVTDLGDWVFLAMMLVLPML